MIIPVAHDFTCPWCWVGLKQAQQMEKEFGVTIEWLGYELWPEELEYPQGGGLPAVETNRPKTPTRMELAYAAQGMEPPTTPRPKGMRTHNAHEAVEFAKTEGVAKQLVEKLYDGLWEKGLEINNPGVIAELAKGIVKDIPRMLEAIEGKRFKEKIVGFDDPAYATGIYNVPTFTIEGVRYAEQPYSVLRKAFGK